MGNRVRVSTYIRLLRRRVFSWLGKRGRRLNPRTGIAQGNRRNESSGRQSPITRRRRESSASIVKRQADGQLQRLFQRESMCSSAANAEGELRPRQRRLAPFCPGARVVLMSGFDPGCDECPYSARYELISKTFSVERLVRFVSRVLSKPPQRVKAGESPVD